MRHCDAGLVSGPALAEGLKLSASSKSRLTLFKSQAALLDGRLAKQYSGSNRLKPNAPEDGEVTDASLPTYRGNYNVTRYCRERETEFARLAIESVLSGRTPPPFPAAATTAYGCPLRNPLGRKPRTGEGA